MNGHLQITQWHAKTVDVRRIIRYRLPMAWHPWHRQPYFDQLWRGITSTPEPLHLVVGPRGAGKTIMASQVLDRWPGPKHYATADLPYQEFPAWITAQWQRLRPQAVGKAHAALLVLDEAPRVPGWARAVRHLLDEAHRDKVHLRVLVLSSSWRMAQHGLREHLATLHRLYRHTQWSYPECFLRYGFRMSFEDYLLMGGYPGALLTRTQEVFRWGSYLRDTIIESAIGKDLLAVFPVQKHALLRRALCLACAHATEVLSYNRLMDELPDAGNTGTLANYFDFLKDAFLLAPLPRWNGGQPRQRESAPKIVLRDNGLITSILFPTLDKDQVTDDWKKRLLKNAVGAVLVNLAEEHGGEVFYWRDRQDEVDYVLRLGDRLIGVDVFPEDEEANLDRLLTFRKRFPKAELVLIGRKGKLHGIRYALPIPFFKEPERVLIG